MYSWKENYLISVLKITFEKCSDTMAGQIVFCPDIKQQNPPQVNLQPRLGICRKPGPDLHKVTVITCNPQKQNANISSKGTI